jgi:DNA polymerase-4
LTPLRTLYIDMNSFFASVEQQVEPALRGRPVGITAVEAESGCVVAASYEAKAFGVKTGTRVYEARRLCPGIVFRPSRHRLYVRYNQRIAAVLDSMAELERIRSVDEFQIVLGGTTSKLDAAIDLTRRLKSAVLAQVGSQLRFSAGLGPNHLLAKIAGKLEKPDGLQWLAPENMPGRIEHLKLDDLPGISRGIHKRLLDADIWSMRQLYSLDPRHARMIWRSVEGERFVRALQGEDIPIIETQRSSYGNSKVLAPKYRSPRMAYLVGRWLVEKSAERLRRDGYCAPRFCLSVSFMQAGGWSGAVTCTATQDTGVFLRLLDHLWSRVAGRSPVFGSVLIRSIGVRMTDIIRLQDRPAELFLPLEAGRRNQGEKLSSVVDQINRRYGHGTVRFGVRQDHPGFFDRG